MGEFCCPLSAVGHPLSAIRCRLPAAGFPLGASFCPQAKNLGKRGFEINGSKYQLAGRHQTYSIPECKKGAPLRGRLYKRVVFASLKGAMGEKTVFPKAGGFRRLTAPGFKPPPGLWALGVSGSSRRAGWFREGVIYAACWRQPRSGYKTHRPQGDTTTL